MVRTLLVLLLATLGAYYALQGPFYALLFYIWNAYFRPEDWVWTDFIRNLRLSYLIGMYLVLTSLFSRQKFILNGKICLVLLYLLHTCLSMLFSEHFAASWLGWQDFLKSIIITYLIVVLVNDLSQFRLVLLVVVLSLGFEGAKQGWVYLLTAPGVANSNPIAFLGDNNGVAVGMLMLGPICAALAQTTKHKWAQFFYWFLLVGVLYRALSTYSRGGFLACLALGAAYWLRSRQKLRMLLGIALVIAVVLPALPDAFWNRMQTIQTYEEDEGSAQSRLHFWAVARQMAQENPLLGVGYLGYNSSYNDYDFSQGQYGRNRFVHSAYFGVLAELGYPGAILFGLICFCAFCSCRRVRRLVRKNAKPLEGEKYAVALEVSLIVFLVGSLFLSFHSSEMFWHYIGLTIVLEKIMTQDSSISKVGAQKSQRQRPVSAALPLRLRTRPARLTRLAGQSQ